MKLVANCKDDVYFIKMVNFKAVVLFIRILTCFISHKTFGTGLHQGDLLEKFKENNLPKVNCLKGKPSRMFSLA